jgi:hypothetical protein
VRLRSRATPQRRVARRSTADDEPCLGSRICAPGGPSLHGQGTPQLYLRSVAGDPGHPPSGHQRAGRPHRWVVVGGSDYIASPRSCYLSTPQTVKAPRVAGGGEVQHRCHVGASAPHLHAVVQTAAVDAEARPGGGHVVVEGAVRRGDGLEVLGSSSRPSPRRTAPPATTCSPPSRAATPEQRKKRVRTPSFGSSPRPHGLRRRTYFCERSQEAKD